MLGMIVVEFLLRGSCNPLCRGPAHSHVQMECHESFAAHPRREGGRRSLQVIAEQPELNASV